MKRICLVEDEIDLLQILSLYLQNNNWEVLPCSNLKEAMPKLDMDVDCWVVDIMLPDGSGFELLKEVKRLNPQIPVILISARGESVDRVIGFEIGCDDYIAKPFLPAELVFRLKKLLHTSGSKSDQTMIRFGPYVMNTEKRIVTLNGEKLILTSREYDIIYFFIQHHSAAISRDQLLQQIWGDDYFGSERVVDNYIKRIRSKMPELQIETIYGFGYRCNL